MDKPQITNIQGSTPAGLGGVVGALTPQSLVITGTNFADGMLLVFESAHLAPEILRQPFLQLTDTGAVAVVDIPVPIQGTPSNPTWIAWAVANGLASDAFVFPVGKS